MKLLYFVLIFIIFNFLIFILYTFLNILNFICLFSFLLIYFILIVLSILFTYLFSYKILSFIFFIDVDFVGLEMRDFNENSNKRGHPRAKVRINYELTYDENTDKNLLKDFKRSMNVAKSEKLPRYISYLNWKGIDRDRLGEFHPFRTFGIKNRFLKVEHLRYSVWYLNLKYNIMGHYFYYGNESEFNNKKCYTTVKHPNTIVVHKVNFSNLKTYLTFFVNGISLIYMDYFKFILYHSKLFFIKHKVVNSRYRIVRNLEEEELVERLFDRMDLRFEFYDYFYRCNIFKSNYFFKFYGWYTKFLIDFYKKKRRKWKRRRRTFRRL